ncbi:MAG: carbohydrate ABC transporter permease [Treponema sp.]|jgi:putative aldouronate transport system permease protein|nr:carbohydrate ABC transporter permease [Treponema sp.]
MKRKIFSRQGRDDILFDSINHILLVILLLIILYPLYFIVIASFSDPAEVTAGKIRFLPVGFNMGAYRAVFRDTSVWLGYRNTIFYTVAGTFINLVMTVLAAYPLSRADLKGRGILTAILAFTMFFGGGLIPTYLLISNLKMLNTVWAMIIPNAVSVWNIVITRTFMQTGIPKELQDAAFIDGCGNTRTLVSIVLPLSKPVLAVMLLFYAVGHWNAFFNALIYLSNYRLYPLQLVLRQILIQSKPSAEMLADMDTVVGQIMLGETIKYALIIVATVPILCVYPFLQKHFVHGVMVGAIKG